MSRHGMKVAHLTSVHQRYDTRIFLKECKSLASNEYKVFLLVADGKGDECRDRINIHDVGTPKSRFDRIRNTPKRLLQEALELDAEIYHLHDPELIPLGLHLKKNSKTVVFDAHEDFPKQLKAKPYLGKAARFFLSKAFGAYERWAFRKFDCVIAATPYIREKLLAMGVRTVDVNNYPLVGELSSGPVSWGQKRNAVAYVGGVSRIRGISEVVKAMGITKSKNRLQLVGKFNEPDVEWAVQSERGWSQVDAHGFLGRDEVRDILSRCVGGVVTFLPSPNHNDAQPNKMFEYMSAGVPVIASHFALWKKIIEGNRCGICVDPLDPQSIADAIDYLVAHPVEAEQMGRNGQRAVLEMYNWSIEEKKLFDLYDSLAK